YSAACDQLDWVTYLITLLMRLLPSTSSTSARSSDACSTSKREVPKCMSVLRGFDRKRARARPDQCNGWNTAYAPVNSRHAELKPLAVARQRVRGVADPAHPWGFADHERHACFTGYRIVTRSLP